MQQGWYDLLKCLETPLTAGASAVSARYVHCSSFIVLAMLGFVEDYCCSCSEMGHMFISTDSSPFPGFSADVDSGRPCHAQKACQIHAQGLKT